MCSLEQSRNEDSAAPNSTRVLAEVLFADTFAEEVLVEDVYVREKVLHILWMDLIRRLGELLEEVSFGLRLRLRVRLQRWVHLVKSLQLLECY